MCCSVSPSSPFRRFLRSSEGKRRAVQLRFTLQDILRTLMPLVVCLRPSEAAHSDGTLRPTSSPKRHPAIVACDGEGGLGHSTTCAIHILQEPIEPPFPLSRHTILGDPSRHRPSGAPLSPTPSSTDSGVSPTPPPGSFGRGGAGRLLLPQPVCWPKAMLDRLPFAYQALVAPRAQSSRVLDALVRGVTKLSAIETDDDRATAAERTLKAEADPSQWDRNDPRRTHADGGTPQPVLVPPSTTGAGRSPSPLKRTVSINTYGSTPTKSGGGPPGSPRVGSPTTSARRATPSHAASPTTTTSATVAAATAQSEWQAILPQRRISPPSMATRYSLRCRLSLATAADSTFRTCIATDDCISLFAPLMLPKKGKRAATTSADSSKPTPSPSTAAASSSLSRGGGDDLATILAQQRHQLADDRLARLKVQWQPLVDYVWEGRDATVVFVTDEQSSQLAPPGGAMPSDSLSAATSSKGVAVSTSQLFSQLTRQVAEYLVGKAAHLATPFFHVTVTAASVAVAPIRTHGRSRSNSIASGTTATGLPPELLAGATASGATSTALLDVLSPLVPPALALAGGQRSRRGSVRATAAGSGGNQSLSNAPSMVSTVVSLDEGHGTGRRVVTENDLKRYQTVPHVRQTGGPSHDGLAAPTATVTTVANGSVKSATPPVRPPSVSSDKEAKKAAAGSNRTPTPNRRKGNVATRDEQVASEADPSWLIYDAKLVGGCRRLLKGEADVGFLSDRISEYFSSMADLAASAATHVATRTSAAAPSRMPGGGGSSEDTSHLSGANNRLTTFAGFSTSPFSPTASGASSPVLAAASTPPPAHIMVEFNVVIDVEGLSGVPRRDGRCRLFFLAEHDSAKRHALLADLMTCTELPKKHVVGLAKFVSSCLRLRKVNAPAIDVDEKRLGATGGVSTTATSSHPPTQRRLSGTMSMAPGTMAGTDVIGLASSASSSWLTSSMPAPPFPPPTLPLSLPGAIGLTRKYMPETTLFLWSTASHDATMLQDVALMARLSQSPVWADSHDSNAVVAAVIDEFLVQHRQLATAKKALLDDIDHLSEDLKLLEVQERQVQDATLRTYRAAFHSIAGSLEISPSQLATTGEMGAAERGVNSSDNDEEDEEDDEEADAEAESPQQQPIATNHQASGHGDHGADIMDALLLSMTHDDDGDVGDDNEFGLCLPSERQGEGDGSIVTGQGGKGGLGSNRPQKGSPTAADAARNYDSVRQREATLKAEIGTLRDRMTQNKLSHDAFMREHRSSQSVVIERLRTTSQSLQREVGEIHASAFLFDAPEPPPRTDALAFKAKKFAAQMQVNASKSVDKCDGDLARRHQATISTLSDNIAALAAAASASQQDRSLKERRFLAAGLMDLCQAVHTVTLRYRDPEAVVVRSSSQHTTTADGVKPICRTAALDSLWASISDTARRPSKPPIGETVPADSPLTPGRGVPPPSQAGSSDPLTSCLTPTRPPSAVVKSVTDRTTPRRSTNRAGTMDDEHTNSFRNSAANTSASPAVRAASTAAGVFAPPVCVTDQWPVCMLARARHGFEFEFRNSTTALWSNAAPNRRSVDRKGVTSSAASATKDRSSPEACHRRAAQCAMLRAMDPPPWYTSGLLRRAACIASTERVLDAGWTAEASESSGRSFVQATLVESAHLAGGEEARSRFLAAIRRSPAGIMLTSEV